VIELADDERAELVSRLTALRGLARELSEAFDEPRARAGAQAMLASIDRMLELLAAPGLDSV
jgi:hypothetical protein